MHVTLGVTEWGLGGNHSCHVLDKLPRLKPGCVKYKKNCFNNEEIFKMHCLCSFLFELFFVERTVLAMCSNLAPGESQDTFPFVF